MNLRRIIILSLLFFPAAKIFAYSPDTTHKGLAEQSVIFYNRNFSRQVSDPEKELMITGAASEDSPVARVLNHFYDPIRNIGINNYTNAKDWATKDGTGNVYTWSAAINEYAKGNKENAFIYLGHILHLLEDMSVPDHTRNDPHMGVLNTGESSYENWAKLSKDRATLKGVVDNYSNEKPLYFNNILEYFDFVANYSNKNFFGDDSIKNDVYQYQYPKIYKIDGFYGYGRDEIGGDSFRLVKLINNPKNLGEKMVILSDKNDTSVLSGYFDRLGKQAILAGAGVIDLFLREAETARAEYLKRQVEIAKIETQKAIDLNAKLQNSNFAELVVYGASSFIGDKIVSPISSTIVSATDNFSSGSRVVSTTVRSAASFASFTTTSLAKQAAASVGSVFASPAKTLETVTAIPAKNNIPDISLAISNTADISTEVSPINSQVANEPAESVQPPLPEDYFSKLSEAYSALSLLNDLTPKQAPVTVSLPAPYSPGFGAGGDAQPPVDNVIEPEKEPISGTPTESAPSPEPASMPEEEAEASSTESTLIEEIIEAVLPILDITAPDVSLTVLSCDDSLADDGCLLATTTVSVSWSSGAEDLDYFRVTRDGETSTTTDTSLIFITENKTSHKISVEAVDKTGNFSDSVSKTFKIFKNPIIINEVAWGGTRGHSEDEWIELRNLSDETISIDGWKLLSKTDNSPNITLSGKISPNGYYLIERKNDEETDEAAESPVRNVPADLWVSFGTGLNNGGENLVLSRASTTLDEVP
ncbi:MAG TPA: lamin tail domain-containing protein, partial [Candidatus Paceibacterota bacterium]|nr:lamin tail domain-containing protein [Candidatus Paceibacterota bacterium]